MKLHCKFGRPKTVVFFVDHLQHYKSPSKPRCSVYVFLGQSKKKLAKTHVTSDYSWETEIPVTLPPDVTDDSVLTLRVMDNKKEVGSTSVQLYLLPFDTPHRTGRSAFPSIPHKLEEAPARRHARPSGGTGTAGFALHYSCWIRDVDAGESQDEAPPAEHKSGRAWRPFRRLRKAFSRSNLTSKDLTDGYSGGGGLKKKYAKSMYDLSVIPTAAEQEMFQANGMTIRAINLDEPCPPPAGDLTRRHATSLHDLAAMGDVDLAPSSADQLMAWVRRQVPCPPGPPPADGEEAEGPSIREVEPRQVVWGEENVLSIVGHNLGNAGRDIDHLLVCGIDVTDSCYSDPPSEDIPHDHIMCHIHGDEDGLPMPRPGESARRGHVEIFYKDGRYVRSVQKVTLVASSSPAPEQGLRVSRGGRDEEVDSDLSNEPAQSFDLDNFHPRSGALQATREMVAAGAMEAERCCGAEGEALVVVKPRVSSFSGVREDARVGRHEKNSSMPHLGPCEPPAEEEQEEQEERKARRGSDKSGRGMALPRFYSRSRLDLSEAGAAGEGPRQEEKEGEEEVEDDSMADSAYDTLKAIGRNLFRHKRRSQSRSNSSASADLMEENQRLKQEKQNLKEDIEELWAENSRHKKEIVGLQRKLHEMTKAFEKHKSEADTHRNELMKLKSRLLLDQMDHYLCIDA